MTCRTHPAVAVKLCFEVIQIDVEIYLDGEMERLENAGMNAFLKVIGINVGNCSLALVDLIYCRQTCDVGRQSKALAVFSICVQA